MLNWFKNIFGIAPKREVLVLDEPVKPEPKPKAQKSAAKPKKKAQKSVKVDLAAMKKDELLAHAKSNGVKANASMSKQKIIDAINAG